MDRDTSPRSSAATSKVVPATTGTHESSGTENRKAKGQEKDALSTTKRRCVSTACIACRRRKSKCDGNLPKCAACASVYLTVCEYAPHTDHRRKGVYKKDAENLKTKGSTLHSLVHALLNYEEDEAFDLLRQIRGCDNLEELAKTVENKEKGMDIGSPDSPIYGNQDILVPQFEAELSGKMGDLLVDGSVKFIGGTSNLIWLEESETTLPTTPIASSDRVVKPREEAILSWTTITRDKDDILHFMNMYFCWHYAYFTTLSKELFYRDFLTGNNSQYCSPVLVNVMLALGCHFSSRPTARADPEDSTTIGDHFLAEAKRFLHEDDEFANPKLCTVQALALMSVREAGCGRESKGWVYSGMSFRMASDLGLNVDAESISSTTKLSDEDIDARRITFWGCFLFDKCWSNYLGRQPQLIMTDTNVKKPEVFASEDSEMWSSYTDSGLGNSHSQPARTRAVALQTFKLAEMSSDLMTAFYQPQNLEKANSKHAELKKLSDIHTRLEAWKKDLPAEFDPKDGQLPQVLLMHMFYQLLYIHLYRPFLKYTKATSPLPSHISPRKFCTQAAGAISKLFRLYKRTYGLRQICNIAVYIAHSACTIHLLNLPDKNARRDIIHGVKQLEEIGECWTCARRTLRILGLCAERWKIDLPEEVRASFIRSRQRWGSAEPFSTPLSPGTISNLGQLQAASEFLTPNIHMQQDPRQHLHSTGPPLSGNHSVSSLGPGTMAIEEDNSIRAPSEITNNTNGHESGGLRPLAQLTKAQQDRWNAHQARMISPSGMMPRKVDELSNNAAILFGGVDSLMEESQDWWYNDQSQLAMGFDNWTSPTAAEWPSVSNRLAMSIGPDTSMTSQTGTSTFYDGNVMAGTYAMPDGYTQGSSTSHRQQQQQQQHQQQHHYRHLPQRLPHHQQIPQSIPPPQPHPHPQDPQMTNVHSLQTVFPLTPVSNMGANPGTTPVSVQIPTPTATTTTTTTSAATPTTLKHMNEFENGWS